VGGGEGSPLSGVGVQLLGSELSAVGSEPLVLAGLGPRLHPRGCPSTLFAVPGGWGVLGGP